MFSRIVEMFVVLVKHLMLGMMDTYLRSWHRDGFEFGRHGVAAAESVILVVYTIVLAILHRQVQNAIE